jgi:predicted small lipoprotein YifL
MPLRRLLCLLALATLTACGPQAVPEHETPAAEHGGQIVIETPPRGVRAQSPLVVSGEAPNNWFFEAVFPVILVGDDGRVIAEAPAEAQSDWTAPGTIRFRAQLVFVITEETPATLVLQEDMPTGLAGEREVRLPVVLLPPQR